MAARSSPSPPNRRADLSSWPPGRWRASGVARAPRSRVVMRWCRGNSRVASTPAVCSSAIAAITLGLGEPTSPSSPRKKTFRLPYSSMPRASCENLSCISALVASLEVESCRSCTARLVESGVIAATSRVWSASSRLSARPRARIASSSSPPFSKPSPSSAPASMPSMLAARSHPAAVQRATSSAAGSGALPAESWAGTGCLAACISCRPCRIMCKPM